MKWNQKTPNLPLPRFKNPFLSAKTNEQAHVVVVLRLYQFAQGDSITLQNEVKSWRYKNHPSNHINTDTHQNKLKSHA